MSNLYCKDLHTGTIQAMQKLGKEEFIEENYDYAALYARLGRKYIGALPEDIGRDLLMDAFLEVFCRNGEQNFSIFSGSKNGTDVLLHYYISTLFSRALINAGKTYTNKSSNELCEYDDEGNSRIDYLNTSDEYNRSYKIGDLHREVAYLEDEINHIKEQLSKDISDSYRKKLEARLEKALDKYNPLVGKDNSSVYYDRLTDDGVFTLDEDLDFDSLVEHLHENLYKLGYSEDFGNSLHIRVLYMLSESFTPKEITNHLQISNRVLNETLDEIKEALIDLTENDKSLLKLVSEYTDNFEDVTTHFIRGRETHLSVDEQIEDVFGMSLAI